jgi:hypothetical protein
VRLDDWWATKASTRRLDRNSGNLAMLVGLMLPSLSIILQGPSPNSVLIDMPDDLQIVMCSWIFLGCGTKLHGALSGSRWYFPNTELKNSYKYGYIGAPIATAGCLVYGWFILSATPTFLSALGGVATPLFGIGISFQAAFYWLESRRINRRERILTREAKARNDRRHDR